MYMYSKQQQSGSTLLEVLIAMLISAIALLGFAGMQIRAQQEHKIAYLRTKAIGIASYALEVQKNNYRYARDGNSAFTFLPTDPMPGAPSVNCVVGAVASCTPTEYHLYEKYKYLGTMRANLPESGMHLQWIDDPDPGGYSTLVATYTGPQMAVPKHPVLAVTIAWREPEMSATATDPNCAFSTAFAGLQGYRCTYMSTNL